MKEIGRVRHRRINIAEATVLRQARPRRAETCYSFVFWFNHSTDVISAILTFASQNQVFAIHFRRFEKDCFRTETFATENIVENLLLRPFGYFLPPASGFRCESISGLDWLYHLSLSA
jgi:hypothetical protein